MDWQAFRIKKRLGEEDQWRGLSQEFPELLDVLTEDLGNDESTVATQANLIRLYSQYVSEWESFSARGLLTGQPLAA